MKAIIFDFNGTLFYDSHLHAHAWRSFIAKKLGREVSDEEMESGVQGRSNPAILSYFMGDSLSAEDIECMAQEKEAFYREECLRRPNELHLASGAEQLLDSLKDHKIPFAIATSSEIINVRFYFETFNLERWFTYDRVICDTPGMRSKPYPDIYFRAAETIGFEMKDCVVFEDSVSGITSARNAGAGRIFAVNSVNKIAIYDSIDGIYRILDDYKNLTLEDIGF